MVDGRIPLGRYGEQLAVEHLQAAGWQVLDRNWRCREGELDIVARDGQTLVFCEVKTRSGTGFGAPAEAVTAVKARRIRRLAARYLAESAAGGRSWPELRFDVLGVIRSRGQRTRVEHLRGAF